MLCGRLHSRVFFGFCPAKEEAMSVLKPACPECAAENRDPPPTLADLAEQCLRSTPYPALKRCSCSLLDGVLVLRGCLPTYYLKQVAQEVVASLQGVERIDNQIQVVTPTLQ
jgi:hypothetical protein